MKILTYFTVQAATLSNRSGRFLRRPERLSFSTLSIQRLSVKTGRDAFFRGLNDKFLLRFQFRDYLSKPVGTLSSAA
jgi:hypothetical protein